MKKCLDLNGESNTERNCVDSDTEVHTNTKRVCWIIAVLCVVLLVLFIIIIGLAVRIGWLERRTSFVHCTTAECLGASSKIVSKWNTSFDPCQDFWKFSCGEWMHRHPLTVNKGSFGVENQLESSVLNNLRHLLDLVSRDANNVRDPDWKAQRFYLTCMNVEGVDLTEVAFKNMITELGGWDLLNNWSTQRWDKNLVIERLHVDFGVTPFFKLRTERDDSTVAKNIIKILPSGLGLPNPRYYFLMPGNKYETIYTTYMNDIARRLGGTVKESRRFATNTFNFEKRLAEISPPLESYRDPFNHYRKLTVRQLGSLAPMVPWMELLQKYFPNANIDHMTEVMIFNKTYFNELSTILSTTDNRAMHNYLMWQFTFAYAPHLSTKFRKIDNHFYQFFEGVPKPSVENAERWEYCIKVTNKYFGHALGSMYLKHYLVQGSVQEAEDMKDEVQKAFKNYLGNIPWTEDHHTRSLIKEKMNYLSKISVYPSLIRSSQDLFDYYNEFQVQSDFLENIKSGSYFLRKKMEARLIPQDFPDDHWTIFPQNVQAVYYYHSNELVIPIGLLQEPFFKPGAPLSVRFGSLGTHIGSQMFKALDDKGISYQKTGALNPWLSGQSALHYHRKLECLMREIRKNADAGSVNANLTVGELIADVAAVKFAYRAYKDHAIESDLPGIGKNHDQVFFVSYAQSMCENIRPEKVQLWANTTASSPHQSRVMNTLRQLPEFAEAFGCSIGSKMYAHETCRMW